MSPTWKLRIAPLVVALALIAPRPARAAGGAAAGPLPADPCALLQPAEIQALAPNAKIGSGVPDKSMAPVGTGCTYRWGPRSVDWGESTLVLAVIDAAKGWPGVSPDQLREGLLAKIKIGGPPASQIPGVGDVAAFTFEARASDATVEAYFEAKGAHVALTYHAGDSLASKDKLVALLKGAAAKL